LRVGSKKLTPNIQRPTSNVQCRKNPKLETRNNSKSQEPNIKQIRNEDKQENRNKTDRIAR